MTLVSVVIPARNDGEALHRAVGSIEAQQGVTIAEIVIAVGPSDDGTWDEAVRLATKNPSIQVVKNPTGRTPCALNLAVRASVGDVIVRVDARSVLPPDYVANALETMEATSAANVGAVQRPIGQNFAERSIAAAMRSRLGSGGARYRHATEAREVETAYLGVFDRVAFDTVEGYDEQFIRNQDSELNIRLRAAGYQVWVDPRLVVEYRPRPNLRALASQYWQYGWWRARTLRKHPSSLRLRQMVVPSTVLFVAGASLCGVVFGPLFLLVPVAYVGLLLGAAALGISRLSPLEWCAFVCALVVMHFSWAAGFVVSSALVWTGLGSALRSPTA